MPDPLVLCTLAVGAAIVAALAGHLLNPARRRRQAQLLRAQQRVAARNRVAGTLAVNPPAWTCFWYEHELDDVARRGV